MITRQFTWSAIAFLADDSLLPQPNPFVSPNHLFFPAHPALSPSITSLDNLSEHLHRQDRLIKAGEAAKEGFRKRIKALEERNRELEAWVNQLEGR